MLLILVEYIPFVMNEKWKCNMRHSYVSDRTPPPPKMLLLQVLHSTDDNNNIKTQKSNLFLKRQKKEQMPTIQTKTHARKNHYVY